ncbi:MAG: 2-C-methyl-D-erythritol 4-phosphate cytidylyltransferase [Bacteroidales bacterium]|nr:2-C-methyl-D-erythritol 4-phosphate cytidylyltransferase [Bacteroidales bacterium]
MRKSETEKFVVIVAGGTGKRMNSELPKQFINLADQPVLMHTLCAFYKFDRGIKIIVVLHGNNINLWNSICEEYSCSVPHKVIKGGETRFDSVKKGLEIINKNNGFVAIHDAARPLVSIDTISRCFDSAMKYGNALPAISPSESVRITIAGGNKPFQRENIYLVQTPQVFSVALIKKAYKQKYKPEFTDDATVFETLGEKINIVEGDVFNIKLTTPEDIEYVEAILKQRNKKEFPNSV